VREATPPSLIQKGGFKMFEGFRKMTKEKLEEWILRNAAECKGDIRLLWSKLMAYCLVRGISIRSLEELGIRNFGNFIKFVKSLNII